MTERQFRENVVRNHNKRIRKLGFYDRIGHYTLFDWLEVKWHHDFRCALCLRSEFEVGKLTVDLIIPLIFGGPNTIENIQPLCRHCNMRKENKILDKGVFQCLR